MVLAPGPLPPACMLQLVKNTFLSSRHTEQLNWMQSCRVSACMHLWPPLPFCRPYLWLAKWRCASASHDHRAHSWILDTGLLLELFLGILWPRGILSAEYFLLKKNHVALINRASAKHPQKIIVKFGGSNVCFRCTFQYQTTTAMYSIPTCHLHPVE